MLANCHSQWTVCCHTLSPWQLITYIVCMWPFGGELGNKLLNSADSSPTKFCAQTRRTKQHSTHSDVSAFCDPCHPRRPGMLCVDETGSVLYWATVSSIYKHRLGKSLHLPNTNFSAEQLWVWSE